ncbi:hypothetical protein [Nannocystis sp.]|uniref:hypothetical protein n=1 Tax=Nannocystis sp. TaxID=1962667 RepID=UPI002420A986|nr:hypothetical protein [Nannocystis sp.]MBK7825632.1 hypothetical protein [Nannocystis sp.]MBK9757158.1 hypothetical protein [Nannocystis sp.]
MTSLRARILAASLPALLSAGGCNFIFNPANSDDVIRCKNTTECEKEDVFFDKLNTERLDATCAAPGGSATFGTSKTNQVCSLVDKASVSCATEMLPAGDFADAVAAADTNKAVYTSCPADQRGKLGCEPTNSGTCDANLEKSEFGICDDGKGFPLYAASAELLYQDIKDQHCRSYFCDDSFVCNSKTSKCVRCDPDADASQGGCGELALAGGPSTVYQSQDALTKACPDVSTFEGTKFGPVVVDPNL